LLGVLHHARTDKGFLSQLASTFDAAGRHAIVDGAILGKPDDESDARRMLALLSGRAHEVLTAIAIETTKDRAPRSLARVVRTEVVFRAIDGGAIDRYLASGEHRDKAGAYGIQGLAMALVREIRGSYTNVVGLPAAETIDLLVESGALASWPVAKA
jgi:septum formation protein